MATLAFISPKSILVRIADIFQRREANVPNREFQVRKATHLNTEDVRSQNGFKSKLNINLEDLKLISTSLLHYRRNLTKLGETDRAEAVTKIDKQFYELITEFENQALRQQIEAEETQKYNPEA
jgi:hypothetical protein